MFYSLLAIKLKSEMKPQGGFPDIRMILEFSKRLLSLQEEQVPSLRAMYRCAK